MHPNLPACLLLSSCASPHTSPTSPTPQLHDHNVFDPKHPHEPTVASTPIHYHHRITAQAVRCVLHFCDHQQAALLLLKLCM